MSSALVWLTFVVLLSASGYRFAASFKLKAADWVRRWEQQVPLRSYADESKDTFRQLFKRTKTVGQQATDDTSRSTQCGYQACSRSANSFKATNINSDPHANPDCLTPV